MVFHDALTGTGSDWGTDARWCLHGAVQGKAFLLSSRSGGTFPVRC
jgi:hypothetical protein